MRITKVYTRTGDDGTTSLARGERVDKDSPRIRVLGSLDEISSSIGVALAHSAAGDLTEPLRRVQNTLFNLGGELAVKDRKMHLISQDDVDWLERTLDGWNESLPPLKEFVLPGGSPVSAQLHHARSVCRRAERNLVTLNKSEPISEVTLSYVNRLSDFLFVAARYQNMKDGGEERMWER
ncbi:MAG: cob(I)yrinic acid a,c-diamide adenosyltransferase [Fidelibacterota bacterium]